MVDAWGIADGYHDVAGTWHETTSDTRRALVAAMGGDPDEPDGPPPPPPWWSVRPGTQQDLLGPCELVLEDGTEVGTVVRLPPDLPVGYHRLVPADGGPTTRLVVAPRRCWSPGGGRAWGWAAQLYATRSRASWGVGDLADLARLARWARGLGAGVVGVNPLHAVAPCPPLQPSPYSPASRRWRNPLYVRVEEVPGAHLAAEAVDRLGERARRLNEDRHLDRDAVWEAKREALWEIWRRDPPRAGFEEWAAAGGDDLRRFATWAAIAEDHGPDWQAWPSALRHAGSDEVWRWRVEHARRVRFHQWLQWLAHQQLLAAGRELPLLGDLAVGVDPGGADTWAAPELYALDARVGAPPDEFNVAGQDWGLPPVVPWRSAASGHGAFAATVRAALAGFGGLRIDHVAGLFRLFWIPPGGDAGEGAYVHYPGDQLLDVLAVESHRAGALIVGEDLGTVEPDTRAALADRGLLSYKVLWFEDDPPEGWPVEALATLTTHDLPTVAGLWSGADLDELRSLGVPRSEEATGRARTRLASLTGAGDDRSVAEVAVEAHRRLAAAPSRLVLATLEDAVGVAERPNVPGTVTERANWSLASPVALEDLEEHPLATEIADALGSTGREGWGAGEPAREGWGPGERDRGG